MTMGPVRSGWVAARIIVAQPPWQLPVTNGLPVPGCALATARRKAASAAVMSASVWPAAGNWVKITK
jgi:hypothetical protein